MSPDNFMRKIIFLRHGHSPSAAEAGVGRDELRPLSERGKAAAATAAKKLAGKGYKPGLILCSPLVRAKATAEIAAAALGAPVEDVRELDGGHPCEDLWSAVRAGLERTDTVMAVGHQPSLGIVAGGLLGLSHFPFQPAGFAVLAFGGCVPDGIRPGCAKDEYLLFDPEL